MSSIKQIVKVMNFHSLLRVSKSISRAELYFESEEELSRMISLIVNNRNFQLDKRILKPKKDGKELNVYIGNDLGFCGNFNSQINRILREDKENDKILIGKKLSNVTENVILRMNKEDFSKEFSQIEKILDLVLKNLKYSKINIIYNHYYNINSFELKVKCIYPVNPDKNTDETYTEDFAVETDLNEIVLSLIALYLCCEIQIAETNSKAAENIMRQRVTKESLKKIDEREIAVLQEQRKENKNNAFKEIVEIYIGNAIKGD